MPDNDDYLSRQLQMVSQQFGLTNPTDQPITNQQHVDNINWKALYKVLESEVETIILILTVQVMSRNGVNVSCPN